MKSSPGRALAQIGNMHAVKPGNAWNLFLRRRVLKPEHAYIAHEIRRYAAGLLEDRGADGASNTERRLVEVASVARTVTMLVLAEAATRGAIKVDEDGSWSLTPGFEALGKFLQIERGCLTDLGTDRRQGPKGVDLDAYWKQVKAKAVDAEPVAK